MKYNSPEEMPKISGGGWGVCSCGCAGFVETPGNRDICQRCGHNYNEHS